MIRYLGVVPARAGSKGLPGKNMADLGGMPMLQWTLQAGVTARCLDRVVLTSDDDAALALARELDIQAVHRPAELAGDETPVLGAVLHTLAAVGDDVESVVLLQPTSPLRDAADIDAAVEAFEASERPTLVSVEPVSQHPCEVVRVDGDRLVRAVEWPSGVTGRQGLPQFFYVNGAIYVARVDHLRREGTFQDHDSAIYVMEPRRGIDIDDSFHLDIARSLIDAVRD